MGAKFEDLTGKVFGRLTVVKRSDIQKYPNRKVVSWECLCVCGKVKIQCSNNLKSGHVRSCGCLKNEMLVESNKKNTIERSKKLRKGSKDIPGTYFREIQNSAKKRKLDFNLTLGYLQNLYDSQNHKCAISGEEIYIGYDCMKYLNHPKEEKTASLDRIDSSKGYIKGNVQWVHLKVNYMKHSMMTTELLHWCRRILEYNENTTCNLQ